MVMRMRTRFLYELPDDNDNDDGDDDSLGIITLDVQYESLVQKFAVISAFVFQSSVLCPDTFLSALLSNTLPCCQAASGTRL